MHALRAERGLERRWPLLHYMGLMHGVLTHGHTFICRSPPQQPPLPHAQPAAPALHPFQGKLPLQGPFPEHDFSSAPLEVTLEELKATFDLPTCIGLYCSKFTELSPGQTLQEHVLQRPEDDPMWLQYEVRCGTVVAFTLPHSAHLPLHLLCTPLPPCTSSGTPRNVSSSCLSILSGDSGTRTFRMQRARWLAGGGARPPLWAARTTARP
jgi:hypothetical protein